MKFLFTIVASLVLIASANANGWNAPDGSMKMAYSGARSLVCYQGGVAIVKRSPVFKLKEFVFGDQSKFTFRERGVRGPREEIAINRKSVACVVLNAFRNGQYRERIVSRVSTIRCKEDGKLVLPRTEVHGLTVTETEFHRIYRYYIDGIATPRRSTTISKGNGTCWFSR